MNSVTFYLESRGTPYYRVGDDRFSTLGLWISLDVNTSTMRCLDLLSVVDEVASGREDTQEWEGQNFDAKLSKDAVKVEDTYDPSRRETYSLDEVREAAEAYWNFLRGLGGFSDGYMNSADNPAAWDALLRWETTWGTHPYRGRLGIPATSPE